MQSPDSRQDGTYHFDGEKVNSRDDLLLSKPRDRKASSTLLPDTLWYRQRQPKWCNDKNRSGSFGIVASPADHGRQKWGSFLLHVCWQPVGFWAQIPCPNNWAQDLSAWPSASSSKIFKWCSFLLSSCLRLAMGLSLLVHYLYVAQYSKLFRKALTMYIYSVSYTTCRLVDYYMLWTEYAVER